MQLRKYDIIVFGATGFTGKLTAQYLAENYPNLKLAIAGRNLEKLNEVKSSLSANSVSVGSVVVNDINDTQQMDEMCRQAKVILTTAGPFAQIGSKLVDSCVRCDTNYCDITGEPQFVKAMIAKHHEAAKQKKLKIVPCCGFDSIPSDLGSFMLIQAMKKQSLQPLEIRFHLMKSLGGVSGGTVASIFNLIESSTLAELSQLADPYVLRLPYESKPTNNNKIISANSDVSLPGYDKLMKISTAPFIMQGINTRIVHRSNLLNQYAYGKEFVYSERMVVPNFLIASIASMILSFVGLLGFFPWSRKLLKYLLPKPGQGPTLAERNQGYFYIQLWGKGRNSDTGKEEVLFGGINAPEGDPGYKQTAKLLGEAGVSMILGNDPKDSNSSASSSSGASDGTQQQTLPAIYGVITPSTAFGQVLIDRLKAKGIEFYVK